ncbi:MAG: winged helix-turn-helix domain-containing protein [Woeseiaceae bacterium]|nr:winged helix-turn-helix domain-containing protein [Woeseiaceae bacterium]
MSTPGETHLIYRFGDFTLDTARGALLENGTELKLRPQSIAVLEVLLENQGQLVGKDTLHGRVWGQKAVTDDSLAQCLVDIRRALGDSGRQLVRTVPRRGYLFDGAVTIEQREARRERSGRLRGRSLGLGATILVVLGAWLAWFYWSESLPARSIAVLPFMDMSAEQDLQHIGQGLAEDILNTLAHHPALSVIARTSSFAYGAGSDIETIGRGLNTAYVLEGSVRRQGGGYRVVAQLIDASDSTHVWSRAFEVGAYDLPSVHEQISREVWRRIAPDTDVALEPTVRPGFAADEAMLLARHYERSLREAAEVDPDMLTLAIQRYRDAAAARPDSPAAHAGLARVLLFAGDHAGAGAEIAIAASLDSRRSDVQDVLGRYLWLTGEPGAGDAWREAIALNPNNADAIGSYGYWLWVQGRIAEAGPHLYRARDLDRGSLSRYADLGNFLGNEARIEEVDAVIDEILERFDSAESYRVVARLLDLIGRVDESIAWLVRARDKDPRNPVYDWALAELFVDIADHETALRLDPEPSPGLLLKMGRYEEFIDAAEMHLFEEPGDLTMIYLLAFAYNTTGRHEQAVWLLDRTGLIDRIRKEVRSAWDLEAVLVWIDASFATGNVEAAHEMVRWSDEFPHTRSANWWRFFYGGCTAAAAGDRQDALADIEMIPESPRLPFLYLVRDAHCMQGLKLHPRYVAVLEDIGARQREIREALPGTLDAFGVGLRELAAQE